jgi:hypothetical protein
MVSPHVITDQKICDWRKHVFHCDNVGECHLAGMLLCGGLCHH